MRKVLAISALAMVSLGATLGVAAAAPTGDFAAGNGYDGTGHFVFRAQQQTIANAATGRMSYKSATEVVRANVICLNVEGDLAFILGEIDQAKSSGILGGAEHIAFEVADVPGADSLAIFFANPVLGCNLPPFSGEPILRGHIVVRDGTP